VRRLFISVFAFLCAVVFVASAPLPSARAQQPADADAPAARDRQLLGLALSGESGRAALTEYLAGSGEPEAIARRASALLEILRGFATMDSYLTGMLVEPADSLSDVVLSGPVRRRLVSDVKRFDLEKEILSVAARAAEGLVPAEEPEFDRREKATDN